jgi:hypothetical protein
MIQAGASPGIRMLWMITIDHFAVIAQSKAPALVKHCTEALPPSVAVCRTFAQEPAMKT